MKYLKVFESFNSCEELTNKWYETSDELYKEGIVAPKVC